MKILKKLLLVGLCSFCFCITTKAYTNEDFPDVSSFVGTSNYAFNYNTTANRIDVVYCKNDAVLGTQYIVGGNLTGGKQYKCSSGAFYMRRLYKNGSLFTDWTLEDLNNEVYDFTTSEYSWSPEYSSSNNYGSTVIYNFDKERLYILSDLYDSAGVIYTPNDIYYSDSITPILLADVFEEEKEENVCDRTAVLGAVSNVNEIKLNVKGDTSVFYPLKGTFTLNYTSVIILSEENFSVDFVNNSEIDVVGNHTFKCSTDSNNCYLNYEYSSMDDIIETIDFSFKIRSADNGIMPLIKIYACATNDDYTNISYDYSNGPSDSTTSNPSLDNYLNDLTPPSSDISSLGNIQGILPEGPVDGLLNIPFKVISILIDGFNGTCKPISFNFVFDMPLTFPCVGDELYDHMDSTLMLFVNIVPTAFILIKWFKNLYVRVQRATSLETTTDDEWGGI